ncbi:WD repeat protein-like protein [Westerdykella ornata]|uniref:WD repeat protein-like protein n=1 Tax=Westerdykella ornata TaxID=318751 RepID=A0A6A6JMN5_WESOR|nr:WD repeat protein-like protein [Westerdykella ornata]KAF2276189.1 WD repeat protein-like protein [Westerdykella ornata]
MGRNARKRISYVLPLSKSAGGHGLGVNGLAVDPVNSILYSGGRDGLVCTWDLHLDLTRKSHEEGDPLADSIASNSKPPPTQFRQQVQAHSHWINDIVLAQGNSALVSASSDITVKVWRPAAQDVIPPQTIGLHTDYVKRVASPGHHESWIASGGLDHKIKLWDLNGAGERLEITAGDDERSAKGSVYALAATPSIIASGGPESVVRIWDPRTGKRITKFVGHTDIVRDVLITRDGDTILTASSDQTVKVWSVAAGRCMYTLTMHNDSVWSLYSEDPRLSVFYSADRSGIVAKSDVRNCAEMDEGISVAVCQEHGGVFRVVHSGGYLWTATQSSSINRWSDVQTAAEILMPESYKQHRSSVGTTRSKFPSPPAASPPPHRDAPKIPFKALLQMSNTAPFPFFTSNDPESSTSYSATSARNPTESLISPDSSIVVPVRDLPDFTIEGQNGLIKHHLLNDRRRVLTLDTAGEVMMWDLLQCVPIKSFGKRHLEDVVPEVNTRESVAHWCAVDTRTGSLTCTLEENYCFDAEMYADELELDQKIEFRDDQRINLGKWILRYLFANLIDEEIKRDEAFRHSLLTGKSSTANRSHAPLNIQIPPPPVEGWRDATSGPTSSSTIRANDLSYPVTPGMAIGLATPGVPPSSSGNASHVNALTPTTEEGAPLEKSQTQQSQPNTGGDYFSSVGGSYSNATPAAGAELPSEGMPETLPQSPSEEMPATKKGKALFSKKFNMSFNMKKFGSPVAAPETPKPAAADDKAEESDSTNKTDEKAYEDSFLGTIQKIRQIYEDQVNMGVTTLNSQIMPSLPNDTPVLKPPESTTILIQEDRPNQGGVADLFEGKVGTLGLQADLIEKVAPAWLADVLLKNQLPHKEVVKVSFILEPYQNLLPSLSSDGYIPLFTPSDRVVRDANPTPSNNRLNANRMLRARKILAYVAERIEPPPEEKEGEEVLKPEEYLELYCQGQVCRHATFT